MVSTIFPTPNTYTPRQGRQVSSALMAGATSARPLGAVTGVRPGTPASTVTATTTTVTVQPFAGIADVQTLAIAGPYEFAFADPQTFALVAQSSSAARSDIVYVQINDNQEDGTGGTNSSSATCVYQAGTSVTIPTPPNTRTFVIAVINVPIAGSSPTVTWVAPYCVAAGAPIPVASKAAGDALYAYPGLKRWRLDKQREETYFDTSGKAVAGWYQTGGNPEVGVFAYNTAAGYADASALAMTTVEKSNGFVTLVLATTKATAVLTGDTIGTLPVGFRPRSTQNRVDFGGSSNTASPQNYIARDTGVVNVYNPVSSPTGAYGSATFRAADAPVAD